MELLSSPWKLKHFATAESAMFAPSQHFSMPQANNFSAYCGRIREAHGRIGKWRGSFGYVVRRLFLIISIQVADG